MLSSQASFKASSSGFIRGFSPQEGSELLSAWYGCSKTFRGLVKEKTNSDSAVLSETQPKTTSNLSSNVTWSQGPKGFCMEL